jgi:hypothetical protein
MAAAISTPVMTSAIACSTVVAAMMFPPRLGVSSGWGKFGHWVKSEAAQQHGC